MILGLRAVKTQNHMSSVFWIVNFVMEYLVLICRSLQFGIYLILVDWNDDFRLLNFAHSILPRHESCLMHA